MSSSPARIAANRKNALKSTGPRTEAGKAITRANALKHGLTGAGLALPGENANDLKASFANYMLQMDPQTEAGKALVFKIALCDLRIRRLADVEKAMSSDRMINAGDAFDDEQYDRRYELSSQLYERPEGTLRKLGRFEAGASWVLYVWETLASILAGESPKSWASDEFRMFEALCERQPSFPSADPERLWNLAVTGDETALTSHLLEGETTADRAAWARTKLIEVAAEEIAEWTEILDKAIAATAVARANAVAMAAFDDSKRAILARKYEAAATREMNKALKEFPIVEAAYAESEPIVPDPEPAETCVELASILPADEPEPEEDVDPEFAAMMAELDEEMKVTEAMEKVILASDMAEHYRL